MDYGENIYTMLTHLTLEEHVNCQSVKNEVCYMEVAEWIKTIKEIFT